MRQFTENFLHFLSLDCLENRHLAQNDPELFLQRYPAPVLIDEIQYAPELFPYIKAIVDRDRQAGMYWLTGSPQFRLLQHLSENLAGRVGVLHLQGFSQAEKNNQPQLPAFLPTKSLLDERSGAQPVQDLHQLYHTIWKGSYPQLVGSDDAFWEIFYDSYLQSYIQRNVRDLRAVGNLLDFMKFMQVLAARTAEVLNYTTISKIVGVSVPTIKSWVSILEASGVIYLLQPFSSNLSKRLTKTPKVYFLDTGLVSYLCAWKSAEVLELGAMSGEILETYVISEILKSYWHQGKNPRVCFYRDKDGREIDLLIEENGKFYPIEIKRKSNPAQGDVKSFAYLKSLKMELGEGAVVCLVTTHLPINEQVMAVPVWYL
ncbi:MAG: ATP-binding protein [Akkermansia sp.]